MIVAIDFLDFLESESFETIAKICLAVLVVIFAFAMVFNVSKMAMDVSENLIYERKQMKKVNKNISQFSSKIVSHLRCSPVDFAQILTDHSRFKDFKFDVNGTFSIPINKRD